MKSPQICLVLSPVKSDDGPSHLKNHLSAQATFGTCAKKRMLFGSASCSWGWQMGVFMNQPELVGGAITILKNMKVSWDDFPIYEMENQIHVPKHQLFFGAKFGQFHPESRPKITGNSCSNPRLPHSSRVGGDTSLQRGCLGKFRRFRTCFATKMGQSPIIV